MQEIQVHQSLSLCYDNEYQHFMEDEITLSNNGYSSRFSLPEVIDETSLGSGLMINTNNHKEIGTYKHSLLQYI